MDTDTLSQLIDPTTRNALLSLRGVIGYGGFGTVYKIGDLAVKIGFISPEEAERQHIAANMGMGLPVLYYEHQAELPDAITRECCPIHKYRYIEDPHYYALMGDDSSNDYETCHCDDLVDMLVMPLAEEYEGDIRELFINDQFNRVLTEIDEICCGWSWDERPANVMSYNGRPVLIDFGDVERDSAYW
jgi:hypothetical protein